MYLGESILVLSQDAQVVSYAVDLLELLVKSLHFLILDAHLVG